MTARTIKKSALLLTLAFTLSLVSGLSAQTDSLERYYSREKKNAMSNEMTFKGKLVCTACSLKKSDGANAQCSVFGHDHSILTKEGKYIGFLPNKQSAPLIAGEKYHNKRVSVSGVFFANANLLDISSFTVNGKKMTWCGEDGEMDEHMSH